jgi:transposase
MGRAYSTDLHEWVVAAVIEGGLSRYQAAAQFEVGDQHGHSVVQRLRRAGSVEPDKIGGYKPRAVTPSQRRAARKVGVGPACPTVTGNSEWCRR